MWISGIHPVREVLESRGAFVYELMVAREDLRVREVAALAESRGIPLHRVDKHNLDEIVGHSHHQGIALQTEEYPYLSLETLLKPAQETPGFLLILDSIQDPQNLGALLRSAAFLGVGGVILPKNRSVRVTGAVIKVAAGAAACVPIARVTNLVRALVLLKEAGYWIVGLDAAGEETLYDIDLTVPVGLVVGNEEKGIRPLVRHHCDLCARIPGSGRLDSLNAAAAGAVAMAEVQRQRRSRRS